MKLKCVSNLRLKMFKNDTHPDLTVGKDYTVFYQGIAHGVRKAFLVYDDSRKWNLYEVKLFEPII